MIRQVEFRLAAKLRGNHLITVIASILTFMAGNGISAKVNSEKKITVDNKERKYVLYVPDNVSAVPVDFIFLIYLIYDGLEEFLFFIHFPSGVPTGDRSSKNGEELVKTLRIDHYAAL